MPHNITRQERSRNPPVSIKIKLTQGLEAEVDDADYLLVEELWRVTRSHGTPYAVTGKPPEMMHRRILPAPPGKFIDHLNGNTLDNRRCNLRVVTATENRRNVGGAQKNNRAGELGIRQTPDGKWMARIMVDRKAIYLGTFPTLEEARKARLDAEKLYHGIQPRRAHLHG